MFRLRLLYPSFVLVLAAVVHGCSGSEPTGPGVPQISSIQVGPAVATVNLGETAQLTATAMDASGNTLAGQAITWASSDAAVASVDASGLLTALAEGSTTISASSEGVSGTASVTVADPPVASVTITPDPAVVGEGRTFQLTGMARDDQGNALSAKALAWSSSNENRATVSQDGVVTGVSTGGATITATSEGVSGSAAVNVVEPSAITIASVTPSPMVEGASATITGTGFGASSGANTVTVGGVAATVTSASETSLTITVPPSSCKPARSAQVLVSVGSETSTPASALVHPQSFADLAVGGSLLLPPGSDLCLQLNESSASETYLLGVTSVASAISTVTPYTVEAEASNLNAAQVVGPVNQVALPQPMAAPVRDPQQERELRFWAEHARGERRIMEQDLAAAGRWLGSVDLNAEPAALASAAAIPANPTVGEQFSFKFADRNGDPLQDFISLTVEVTHVSAEAIFIADVANPAPIPASDYATAGADFDNVIRDAVEDNFGTVSDVDGNGKILVLHTKEVNKLASPPLGFAGSVDLYPETSFAASNVAEVFFARSPDPSGSFTAGTYTVQDAVSHLRTLLGHEFTHIVQLSVRLFGGAPAFPESWVLESGATAAEEIIGFTFEGRSDGQNYGSSAVVPSQGADSRRYYSFLSDLGTYFGHDAQNGGRAPERCSWVTAVVGTQPGPCDPVFGTRLPYGVPYSLIQYWIQRKGLSKSTVHRAITASHVTGFPIIESALGESISTLLAGWAPMLYLDDRAGLNPTTFATWQFENWDLPDVLDGWYGGDPTAQLTPRSRSFSGFSNNVQVRAGSTAYFLVGGSARSPVAIKALESGDNLSSNNHQMFIVRTN
ncbi:MAG: Ig-like domain-containing protein [Longimicrobiales bacterium]